MQVSTTCHFFVRDGSKATVQCLERALKEESVPRSAGEVAANLLAVPETDTMLALISLFRTCSLTALLTSHAWYPIRARQVRVRPWRSCPKTQTLRQGISLQYRTTHVPKAAPADFPNCWILSPENIGEQFLPAIYHLVSMQKVYGCEVSASIPHGHDRFSECQWHRIRTVHEVYKSSWLPRWNTRLHLFSLERRQWARPHTIFAGNGEKE